MTLQFILNVLNCITVCNNDFVLQNKAISDLRDVLRVQTKRNKDIRRENEELLNAIQQIEKQLQVSAMLNRESLVKPSHKKLTVVF